MSIWKALQAGKMSVFITQALYHGLDKDALRYGWKTQFFFVITFNLITNLLRKTLPKLWYALALSFLFSRVPAYCS